MKNFVSGPHTVSVHQLGKKNITVFGEDHYMETLCTKAGKKPVYTTEQYIRQYCKEKEPAWVDLFIESSYVPNKSRIYIGTKMIHDLKQKKRDKISGLRRLFDACAPKWTGVIKSSCPPNLRVHLCDVRQMYGHIGTLSKEQKEILDIFHQLFLLSLGVFEADIIEETVSDIVAFCNVFINDMDSSFYHKNFDKVIQEILKIDKQLAAIQNKKQKAAVVRFFEKEKKTHLSKMKKISRDDSLWANYYSFMDCFLDYQTLYMDMYLIGRMLRQFKDGETPENIIIYVGNYHADRYRRLLKLLRASCSFSFPKDINTFASKKIWSKDMQTCVPIHATFPKYQT